MITNLTNFYQLPDNFQFASLYLNPCVEDLSSAETKSSQLLTALRVLCTALWESKEYYNYKGKINFVVISGELNVEGASLGL